MSIRRAFEKFNSPQANHQHKMREASGIVNEMKVEVVLMFYDDSKHWQLVVDIWNHSGSGELHSDDYVYPKTQAEAEERFNRLVMEYNLKETPPQTEAASEEKRENNHEP